MKTTATTRVPSVDYVRGLVVRIADLESRLAATDKALAAMVKAISDSKKDFLGLAGQIEALEDMPYSRPSRS